MKILISDGLNEEGLALLRPHAQVDDCTGISAEDLLKEIPEYEALVVRSRTRVTAALLGAATRLCRGGRG
jgi:D-3-phosphoglycerate dehydrogenase